ncbi:WhiB family transcriptional regulator [Streptomyces cylindrosporus]|uniref:WhiB family transcriptional regulator n=1 Tax=Streptomyces cylindrosporus TaxID=2927583 RepID=A0ABS9YJW3_9ACTN|nr:WhiB family transcriptional regulator [Streptomyces cylindrosporus]MCI3277479.1 WhiB family transcriptional regulator [Streptomyces cylindrosporus]
MTYTGSTPDTAARPLDWMARMACRDEDPDLFFDKTKTHEARLVCAVRCTVRAECLANVKAAERGTPRAYRDGVAAGLAHNERWRLDLDATRGKDDPAPLILDGTEPCGTHNALLGHLWRGERIDPECWSAEVRRDRLDRVTAARRDEEDGPGEEPLKAAS